MVEKVQRAVEGGVDLVQLRNKTVPGRQLLERASDLLEAISGKAEFLVNERVDVAVAAGAQGVQLGEDALPVPEVRKMLGQEMLIGRSVHSTESAIQAEAEGADFLLVGTMFGSLSHPGEQPEGPQLMSEIAGECRLPLIGIGGVTPDNAAELIEAGASGVAVISNILSSEDPKAAAARLKQVLVASWNARSTPADAGNGDG